MSLRETGALRCVTDRLDIPRHPVCRAPGKWLACYPIFQGELRCGETTFGALPEYVKLAALKRTAIDAAKCAITLTVLKDVGVSFFELGTRTVDEAVRGHFGGHIDQGNSRAGQSCISFEELVTQIPTTPFPLIDRPPCVLRAGEGIFLDGWMRYFSYRARGDLTIPLLAVNWVAVEERLDVLDR